jgi:hypothetical protein
MERQARPAGRWEPAELGVHPVAAGDPRGSMPAYIRRPHDKKRYRPGFLRRRAIAIVLTPMSRATVLGTMRARLREAMP